MIFMAQSRTGYNMPQSSAGILGVASNENMGGLKFDPRVFVMLTTVFILAVIILEKALVK